MGWFYNIIYGEKEKRINDLLKQLSDSLNENAELVRQNVKFSKNNEVLEEVISKLKEQIVNLQQEINSVLLQKSIYDIKQPDNTIIAPHNPFTVDALRVAPNCLITPNSRLLKELIMKNGLKKATLKETADRVEQFVAHYISYVRDDESHLHPGQEEEFQSAEYTLTSRIGDCEDKAILFYTIMMMLGYGNDVLVEGGDVTFSIDLPPGHAYNLVRLDNKWVVYDPTIKYSDISCSYPRKNIYWVFNYAGVYEWRQ